MSHPIDPERLTIAAHFQAVGSSLGTKGPIGELVDLLGSGSMDAAAFNALRKRHGVDGEQWFQKQVDDLFLDYLRSALERRAASAEDLADIKNLRMFLRINDGELIAHRPAELTELLNEQTERILEDRMVTATEELLQVELQSAVGIGYDDYLELTRYEFEQVYRTLQIQASEGSDAGILARQQLKAIEPVYLLATANHKRATPQFP